MHIFMLRRRQSQLTVTVNAKRLGDAIAHELTEVLG